MRHRSSNAVVVLSHCNDGLHCISKVIDVINRRLDDIDRGGTHCGSGPEIIIDVTLEVAAQVMAGWDNYGFGSVGVYARPKQTSVTSQYAA